MILKSILALALIVAAVPAYPAGVPLSVSERKLVEHADAHNEEALALLECVANINSGTHNLTGVREVGKIFRAELDSLGFKTQWVDQDEVKRAGHLIADHPGPGPRILLIGHLDTVFESDSPFQKLERLDAKPARGPGITASKGCHAIFSQSLTPPDPSG